MQGVKSTGRIIYDPAKREWLGNLEKRRAERKKVKWKGGKNIQKKSNATHTRSIEVPTDLNYKRDLI
jgi:hypothetical protein